MIVSWKWNHSVFGSHWASVLYCHIPHRNNQCRVGLTVSYKNVTMYIFLQHCKVSWLIKMTDIDHTVDSISDSSKIIISGPEVRGSVILFFQIIINNYHYELFALV